MFNIRNMKKFALLAALPVLFLVGCSSSTSNTIAGMDEFAQCLTDAGVTMYGTNVCPYCLEQKKMFGDSFEKVTFVNCQEDPQACTDNGIQGIPAWQYEDGTLLQGLQDLEILGAKAGCEVPDLDAVVE